MTRYPYRQMILDKFYWQNGKCCAGCDWWRSINSVVGECGRTRPVATRERVAMLGITGSSLNVGAGQIFTPREHVCGEFKDDFDWSSLPLTYRQAIGATQ